MNRWCSVTWPRSASMISGIFGREFEGQDDFLRQVRMPRPPLLLADRVTALVDQIASSRK